MIFDVKFFGCSKKKGPKICQLYMYKTVVVSKLGGSGSPWRLINYVCSIHIIKNYYFSLTFHNTRYKSTTWLGADEIIAAYSKSLKLLLYNNKDVMYNCSIRYSTGNSKFGEERKRRKCENNKGVEWLAQSPVMDSRSCPRDAFLAISPFLPTRSVHSVALAARV